MKYSEYKYVLPEALLPVFPLLYPSFLATNLHQSILQCRHFRDFSCSVDTELTVAICFPQQLMQAGMGTHFPSAGFSPTTPTVGPESLSVAVAVKNAINDPRLSLKPDANTQQQQQQPNISSVHVSSATDFRIISLKIFLKLHRQHRLNSAQ